jgi:2-phosphosulfolactate phosphatase
MYFDQQSYDIRCDWGLAGLTHLSPSSDAIVIIDVLSFSTCVDIAVANGATVYPYRWRDASADVYAASRGAIAASHRQGTGYSLSPASLRHIPPGTRLVLPSPNGSTLSLSTGAVHTFAGCLRNADAIAQTLPQYGNRFSLIPAGERWPDGSLRFAVEDLLGAGAIIHHLPGTRSPEAAVAEATFLRFRSDLVTCLQQCGSGRELQERNFSEDVILAAALNSSNAVPILIDDAFVRRNL